MTVEYMTVIYRCADDAAANELWAQIRPIFMADEGPITVTGVAKEDQMTRLNTIEDLVRLPNDVDHADVLDMIRDCLDAADIEAWRTEHSDILAEIQP